MRRREFITVLGGAAAWPLTVTSQQPERVRRIGVLISIAESDPMGQVRLAAFREGLSKLASFIHRDLRCDSMSGDEAVGLA